MEGFFPKNELQSLTRPDGRLRTCTSCGLYRTANTPKMQPYGNFRKGIMNIGEAPGETEDVRGKPWQGKAGQLLQKTYKKFGIDLFEDCININAVNCRPISPKGSNRTPTNYEIECCRPSVLQYIQQYKPKIIILFGSVAIQSVIGHRWKKDLGGINKWRGWTIPDQDFCAWICPVFHPSYTMRYEKEEAYTVWEDDLENALSVLNTPFLKYKEPKIEIVDDLSVLEKIKHGIISIDYETTGLKPYDFQREHQIVSASVSIDEDTAYVFKLPDKRSLLRPLRQLLINPNVRKMAHNLKFEDIWSRVYLNTPVKNWWWDSMLAAHIMDNRKGVTGLKFQTYINLGIVDYSSEIDQYLQAIDAKDGNSLNRVLELIRTKDGLMKLLKYNAYDTINQYRLALKQMKHFEI